MYDNLEAEIILLFSHGLTYGIFYASVMFVLGYVINALLSLFLKE